MSIPKHIVTEGTRAMLAALDASAKGARPNRSDMQAAYRLAGWLRGCDDQSEPARSVVLVCSPDCGRLAMIACPHADVVPSGEGGTCAMCGYS